MENLENQIINSDCIELLKDREPFIDLVFADPPFNIGYEYDKYHDKLESENFINWTRDWMKACAGALKPNGSFYIAIGDDYAAHVRIIGEELGMNLRNWIIWHYTFGQQTKAKFARSHTHIFYFTKDEKDFTFNDHAVRIPSDRQLKYNDKRANPQGKMPDDTWNEYSRVCGTFKERLGWHPCQMPESLLSRIIAASSNPGEIVFDPFNGSGTTAAVALKMGRKYCATDISQDYVNNTIVRLDKINKEIYGYEHAHLTYKHRYEIARLCADMGIFPEEILRSLKILKAFSSQMSLRLGGESLEKSAIEAELAKMVREQKGFKPYTNSKSKKNSASRKSRTTEQPVMWNEDSQGSA